MLRLQLKTLKKALLISLRVKTPASLIVSLLGFPAALLPVWLADQLAVLTNELQLLSAAGSSGAGDLTGKLSVHLSGALSTFYLLAALFLCQIVFRFLKSYTGYVDQLATHRYIHETILRRKCEVRYKYIENYDHFQEKIAFAKDYGGYETAQSIQAILLLLQEIVAFSGIFIRLMAVNPLIVALLILTSVPAAVLSCLQKDESYRHRTKWMEEGAMLIHYFYLCAGDAACQEVRHYGLFDYLKARWRSIADDYCGKKNRLTRKHVKYNSAADILRSAVYIAVLLLAAVEIYRNPAVGLGTFPLVLTLSSRLQESSALVLNSAAGIYNSISYMKDFFALDELESEEEKDAAAADPSAANSDLSGSVEVSHLSFSYPDSDRQVLKDISVSIKPGEKIAVVGDNGSGKSTFISLLCGMFDPDEGTVTVDGMDMKKNRVRIRQNLSVVFQDFGHYEASLRDNITVSDRTRGADDQEILSLAGKINTLDMIEEQPGGLDELIGTFSEHSKNLSGGQWQKLSILRAAYRNRAGIMILDEPTSALDPIAEAEIYRDFAELTGSRTTLLISHRLGITSIVDRILVFEDGRITEDGSHKELMERNGQYRELYLAQAQWYQ